MSWETPAASSSRRSCFPTWSPTRPLSPRPSAATSTSIWGTDNLMNRLAAIAARKSYYPPNAEDIRREVAAVTDGQIAYAGEVQDQCQREERLFLPTQPEAPAVPRLEVPAAGITIGHVDTLIVHTGARRGDRRRSGAWNPGASPGSGTSRDHGRSSSRDDRPSSDPPGKPRLREERLHDPA